MVQRVPSKEPVFTSGVDMKRPGFCSPARKAHSFVPTAVASFDAPSRGMVTLPAVLRKPSDIAVPDSELV
jgi:hypothetical protein